MESYQDGNLSVCAQNSTLRKSTLIIFSIVRKVQVAEAIKTDKEMMLEKNRSQRLIEYFIM